MIDKKTQSCKVTIGGSSYSLVTNEPETHVVSAAQLVDSLLKEVVGKSAAVDEKKSAVLVALRLASRVLLMEAEANEQRRTKEQLIKILDRELPLDSSKS